jgi:hypothetical protein
MKHALQLLCELVSALHFKLCEHAPLCVVGYRPPSEETLCEMTLIIPLKDIFIRDVPKYCDGFVQNDIDFVF